MADGTYRIVDEPAPGALGHLTVNPIWPLLALMLCGGWLAWPWFVINAFALGSPAKLKETALVALGIVGTLVLTLALFGAFDAGMLDMKSVRYAALVFPVWKIGIGYFIYLSQASSFGIYEYYGGLVRPGIVIVVLGYVLRSYVIDAVPSDYLIFLAA